MKGSDAIGLGEYLMLNLLCFFRPLHPHDQYGNGSIISYFISPHLVLCAYTSILYFDMHNHLERK